MDIYFGYDLSSIQNLENITGICKLTLALPTGASQAREGTFPTIETLLRPGFFREAMRSLQIALFIIYLAHLTLSEKMTLSEDF